MVVGGGGGVKSFSCKTQPVRLRLGWGFDNCCCSVEWKLHEHNLSNYWLCAAYIYWSTSSQVSAQFQLSTPLVNPDLLKLTPRVFPILILIRLFVTIYALCVPKTRPLITSAHSPCFLYIVYLPV